MPRQFLHSTSTGKVKIRHRVKTSAQHYSMKTDRSREGNALRIPIYLMGEYKHVLRLNIEFLLATSQWCYNKSHLHDVCMCVCSLPVSKPDADLK